MGLQGEGALGGCGVPVGVSEALGKGESDENGPLGWGVLSQG